MGAKRIIHVHQQAAKKRDPQNHPAIIVRTYKGSPEHFVKAEPTGPVTIVHSDMPDSCGATIWISTTDPVICTRPDGSTVTV